MQTFLPYEDYELSARALDRQRLGKQRVECLQLLQAIRAKQLGQKAGWQKHPAFLMWELHPEALRRYAVAVCEEWIRRGYKDTCLDKIQQIEFHGRYSRLEPEWMGLSVLHLSHRSNLLRKLPEHYSSIFPNTPSDIPYFWPVKHDTNIL